MTNHANCLHATTSSARSKCRKADAAAAPRITFRPTKGRAHWSALSAYLVELDGRVIGRVDSAQDSSRTGRSWTCTRTGTYVGGGDTRAHCVAQLIDLAAR